LIKNYRTLAEKKKIQMHFDTSKQSVVVADKLYLYRIFENLISNALKFSPANKHIYTSIEEVENKIVVKVRDEGPGFTIGRSAPALQKISTVICPAYRGRKFNRTGTINR
jgi:signal transduction histidine kinase